MKFSLHSITPLEKIKKMGVYKSGPMLMQLIIEGKGRLIFEIFRYKKLMIYVNYKMSVLGKRPEAIKFTLGTLLELKEVNVTKFFRLASIRLFSTAEKSGNVEIRKNGVFGKYWERAVLFVSGVGGVFIDPENVRKLVNQGII